MAGAMVLMAGAAALATQGAGVSFLHIALGYVKQIVVGGFEALGPGLKAIGVATGNLLSAFGVKVGGMTAVDPAMLNNFKAAQMSYHGAGAANNAASVVAAVPSPGACGVNADPSALAPAMKGQFSSAADWFKNQPSGLQLEFAKNASDLGMQIDQYVENFCRMDGALPSAG